MSKKGYSRQGFFGDIYHCDEHGHKTGTSKPGLFGGYTNYDSHGKKTGHSDPGFFGGYNHYDNHGKKIRSQLEIEFVVNTGSNRYYIQSALSVADEEKRQQEINSLKRVADSFKKIIVVKEAIIPWHDEDGIYYVGIEQFLPDENCINL